MNGYRLCLTEDPLSGMQKNIDNMSVMVYIARFISFFWPLLRKCRTREKIMPAEINTENDSENENNFGTPDAGYKNQ